MPAYNFQTQFAPAVEAGTKCSTIRPWRKDHRDPKVGATLYLYTGMRTKACRRLRTATCTAALPIEINCAQRYVILDGKRLTDAEVIKLAGIDGFTSAADFFAFFADQYGAVMCGLQITW